MQDIKELEKSIIFPGKGLEHVNNIMFGNRYTFHFKTMKDDLESVQPYIDAELFLEIKSIVDDVKLLAGQDEYGFTFIEEMRVESWLHMAGKSRQDMIVLRQKLLFLLMKENPDRTQES